jgi:hypothetical protein
MMWPAFSSTFHCSELLNLLQNERSKVPNQKSGPSDSGAESGRAQVGRARAASVLMFAKRQQEFSKSSGTVLRTCALRAPAQEQAYLSCCQLLLVW